MRWDEKLNKEDKETLDYIREQAKRLGKFHNVELSDNDIRRIYYFAEEHLTDSHQICDVIDLVNWVIGDRERSQ